MLTIQQPHWLQVSLQKPTIQLALHLPKYFCNHPKEPISINSASSSAIRLFLPSCDEDMLTARAGNSLLPAAGGLRQSDTSCLCFQWIASWLQFISAADWQTGLLKRYLMPGPSLCSCCGGALMARRTRELCCLSESRDQVKHKDLLNCI